MEPVFAERDCAGHVLWRLGYRNSSVRDVVDDSGPLVDHVVLNMFAAAAVSLPINSGVSFELDGLR